MKKTLKLALCDLMLAGAMNAQVATLPEGYYDYFRRGTLPKAFSSDGKAKFLATEELEEDGNVKIHIYNSSFNAEHSFEAIPQRLTEKKVTELRAVVATPGELVTLNTAKIEIFKQPTWGQTTPEKRIEWLRHEYNLADLLRNQQDYRIYWHRDSIYTDTNGNVYIYLINDNLDEVEKIVGTCVLNGETLKFQPTTSGEFAIINTEYIYMNGYNISWDQANQEEKIEWLRQNGSNFLYDYDFENPYYISWDRDSIHTDTNGDVYMYLIKRYYDYSAEYEVERAIGAFVLSGETLKFQPITYPRTGEWEVVDTDEYEGINHINFLEDVIDINNDWGHEIFEHPLIATQTLFNADSKYEYIRYKQVAYSNRAGAGWDTDGDAIPDKREVWSGYDRAGIEIVSEDGNVIGSFDVDGEISETELILWGEKRYLGFSVYGEDNDSYQIYEINPNGSGITRASSAAFMHILPAMPKKNTSVTVEFGEESVKNGGQLMITDMSGHTVYRNAVAPGETSVRVPLRRMASGVYNVTLTNDGKKVETSKLIVR